MNGDRKCIHHQNRLSNVAATVHKICGTYPATMYGKDPAIYRWSADDSHVIVLFPLNFDLHLVLHVHRKV